MARAGRRLWLNLWLRTLPCHETQARIWRIDLRNFELVQERFKRDTARDGVWKKAITALINGDAPCVRVPHKGKSPTPAYIAARNLGVKVMVSFRDGYVYIQLREAAE